MCAYRPNTSRLAALDEAGRTWNQSQDRQGGHALAAPALPYDAQRLARVDVEGHVVDGSKVAFVGIERSDQMAQAQQRFAHAAPTLAPLPKCSAFHEHDANSIDMPGAGS